VNVRDLYGMRVFGALRGSSRFPAFAGKALHRTRTGDPFLTIVVAGKWLISRITFVLGLMLMSVGLSVLGISGRLYD
jgi:hypothetical protein